MMTLPKSTNSTDWIRQQLKSLFAGNSTKSLISPISTTIFVVIAGLSALYLQTLQQIPKNTTNSSPPAIDQNIPPGYAMWPVEIVNYETVDSIVGTFSMVNLYTIPFDRNEKARGVAYRVKMFRHPTNQEHFSILIKEDQLHRIVENPGPYRVSILRPNFKTGTHFEKEHPQRKNRISYLAE